MSAMSATSKIMKSVNEDILLMLECPTCFGYMEKPIYLCNQGHSICKQCTGRLLACPLCAQLISKTGRNYALEAIAEMLSYPCENIRAGCDVQAVRKELEDHQNTCSFRIYSCILGHGTPCGWKGLGRYLYNHALRDHQTSMMMGPSFFDCIKCQEPPAHQIRITYAFDETFYVHTKLVDGIFYWAVQYVGKSEDTIQFIYKVTITSEEYEHRSVIFKEIVQDDLGTIDDIIDSHFSVGVPFPHLQTFQNKIGQIWYHIAIIRV